LERKRFVFMIISIILIFASLFLTCFASHGFYIAEVKAASLERMLVVTSRMGFELPDIFNDDAAVEEYLDSIKEKNPDINSINIFLPDNMLRHSTSAEGIGIFYASPNEGELGREALAVNSDGDVGTTIQLFASDGEYLGYVFCGQKADVMNRASGIFIEKAGKIILYVMLATAVVIAIVFIAGYKKLVREYSKGMFVINSILPAIAQIVMFMMIHDRIYAEESVVVGENALASANATMGLLTAGLFAIMYALYRSCYVPEIDFEAEEIFFDGRAEYNKNRTILWIFMFLMLNQIPSSFIYFTSPFLERLETGGLYWLFGASVPMTYMAGFIIALTALAKFRKGNSLYINLQSSCVLQTGGLVMKIFSNNAAVFLIGNVLSGIALGISVASVYSIVYRIKSADKENDFSRFLIKHIVLGAAAGMIIGNVLIQVTGDNKWIVTYLSLAATILMFFFAGNQKNTIVERFYISEIEERKFTPEFISESWRIFILILTSGAIHSIVFYLFWSDTFTIRHNETDTGWAILLFALGFIIASNVLNVLKKENDSGVPSGFLPTLIVGAAYIIYAVFPGIATLMILGGTSGACDALLFALQRKKLRELAVKHNLVARIGEKLMAIGTAGAFFAMSIFARIGESMGSGNQIGICGICIVIVAFVGIPILNEKNNSEFEDKDEDMNEGINEDLRKERKIASETMQTIPAESLGNSEKDVLNIR